MEIHLLGAKLYQADGGTDRHDEAYSRPSKFRKRA